MKTAVLAIAKLENNYIREWTEWYKHLGFTNVIVYDNNDEKGERVSDAIQDYVKSGFAIVEDFRGKYPGKAQRFAYQAGYDKYGNDYDWIAVFDIDEFLVLNEKFKTIDDYLSMECFKGKDLIRVSWRIYDDNGLVRVMNGDYSLMNRFKEPMKRQDKWTKAIVHGGIKDFKVPMRGDGQCHLVNMNCIHDAVDANGNKVSNSGIRGGCGYENAALNHYSTKTIEEFVLNKKKKGYCVEGVSPDILNMDYFFGTNEKTKEKVDLFEKLVYKKLKNILVFYWYVPETYWHPFYNLHLKNLLMFKDIFDEMVFIISTDSNNGMEFVGVESISTVLPEAKFIFARNDKELRESAWFWPNIAKNLDSFEDDVAIFFAHNKGAASIYVPPSDVKNWINAMYYYNLRDEKKIYSLLADEKTCAIGTAKMVDYNVDTFDFSPNKWLYAGTFFWLVPNRIAKYVKENHIEIPDKATRYHAEGFLSIIFKGDDERCVSMHGNKLKTENFKDYIIRNSTENDINDYCKYNRIWN